MPTIDEYAKDGGWYEFPDGTKKQGAKKAQDYLDGLDASELFEDEIAEEETVEESTTEVKGTDEPVEEEKDEEPEEEFLVRMTIPRVKFQEKGPSGKRYTFTRQHPLVVVRKQDTTHFVSKDGFEMATPEQAQEYYS